MGLEFESPAGHQKESYPIRGGSLFPPGDSNHLKATVLWTVAADGLTEANIYFCHGKNADESPAGHQKRATPIRGGALFLLWGFEPSKSGSPQYGGEPLFLPWQKCRRISSGLPSNKNLRCILYSAGKFYFLKESMGLGEISLGIGASYPAPTRWRNSS